MLSVDVADPGGCFSTLAKNILKYVLRFASSLSFTLILVHCQVSLFLLICLISICYNKQQHLGAVLAMKIECVVIWFMYCVKLF